MSQRCTLIADQTDDAVQLALGFVALSSLYCKWHFETPRRPVKIWFLDAMKQGTSAAMIHVLNIICAIGIVDFSVESDDADECAFYFMNVVIDTTLGVYIAYLLLQLVTALAVRRNWDSLKYHGWYGNPPSIKIWFYQLLSWSTILIIMKAAVSIIIYCFRAPLAFFGSLLFFPVRNHPKIELLIVMIGCPLVMNMVQFWIQDSFLKDTSPSAHEGEELPLLNKQVSRSNKRPLQEKASSFTNATNAADMYEDL